MIPEERAYGKGWKWSQKKKKKKQEEIDFLSEELD